MSDITLYRSDAPDTSIEAADGLDTTKLEGLVLKAISKFDKGCISDDIRKYCEVFHGIQKLFLYHCTVLFFGAQRTDYLHRREASW